MNARKTPALRLIESARTGLHSAGGVAFALNFHHQIIWFAARGKRAQLARGAACELELCPGIENFFPEPPPDRFHGLHYDRERFPGQLQDALPLPDTRIPFKAKPQASGALGKKTAHFEGMGGHRRDAQKENQKRNTCHGEAP